MASDNTSWVDFSGTENPFGTPESFITAFADVATTRVISDKPDASSRVFKRALSSVLRLPENTFIVGSTVSGMISAVSQAFESCTAGIMVPCPVEYVLAVTNAGHQIARISGTTSYVTPDFETASGDGTAFDAAVLLNPGFPTSRLLPERVLMSYLDACDWVIVDEHSIELSLNGKSYAPLVEQHRNLIVVQSLCDQYALPGAQVSYLVAHPDVVEEIERFYDATAVNALPELFAEPASREYPKLESVRSFLAGEIPWMQTMLSLVPGIDIFPAEANYVMCTLNSATTPSGIETVGELEERLKDHQCLIRNLTDTPGIGKLPAFCVAVRTRQENTQLIEALRAILA